MSPFLLLQEGAFRLPPMPKTNALSFYSLDNEVDKGAVAYRAPNL